MKANKKFIQRLKNRDDAVSPVIAVILMVAITVVLAATVYVWVSGFGGSNQKMANTQLGATGGNGKIVLKHLSGDAIPAGSWKVSLVPAGESTAYCTTVTTAELGAGSSFSFGYRTADNDGAATACVNGLPASTNSGAALVAGEKYTLTVFDALSNTVLLSKEITA